MENPTSKYLRLLKSTSKTKFSHYLLSNSLMISFVDLVLIFYIWVPNTIIKDVMKKYNLKYTLLLLLGI